MTDLSSVAQGDIAWKQAWPELSGEEQATVREAVLLARPLSSPRLAAAAAGMARRRLRWYVPYAVLGVIVVGAAQVWFPLWSPLWGRAVLVLGLALVSAIHTWLLIRARKANLAAGAQPTEDVGGAIN